MPRDYKQQIDDILQAIVLIRQSTKGMDYDAFGADRKTQDAVIRNLEVIGEAARAMPEDVKQKSDDIEWHKIKPYAIFSFMSILESIWKSFGMLLRISSTHWKKLASGYFSSMSRNNEVFKVSYSSSF